MFKRISDVAPRERTAILVITIKTIDYKDKFKILRMGCCAEPGMTN